MAPPIRYSRKGAIGNVSKNINAVKGSTTAATSIIIGTKTIIVRIFGSTLTRKSSKVSTVSNIRQRKSYIKRLCITEQR